jgi:hypothetical protein
MTSHGPGRSSSGLASDVGSDVTVKPLPAGCGGLHDLTTLAIAIAEDASVNQRVKTLVHELGHRLMRAEAQGRSPRRARSRPPGGTAMKPTPKQLKYLRALAQRTGQTFTWPKTMEAQR